MISVIDGALRAELNPDTNEVWISRRRTGDPVWDGRVEIHVDGVSFVPFKIGDDDAADVIGSVNAKSLERALAEKLLPGVGEAVEA